MSRWFGLGRRADDRVPREIDEEIQSHLDARVAHLTAQGLTPEAARAEALRRFGDIAAGRAALIAHARRRRRRLRIRAAAEQVLQDVRYVGRSLRRAPGFSTGMIATLALGLGITAAVFRIADQVLLRAPAGVRDPNRVVRVETTVDIGGGPQRTTSFSYADAERILASGAFEAAAIYAAPRLQTDSAGRTVAVSAVDARYLQLLGVSPSRGRGFLHDEARPGTAPRVAVVSHAYWERAFGAGPLTGAQTVALGSRTYRVVGIAPQGFTGLDLDPTDLWIPLGDAEFGETRVNGVVIPWYASDMLRALRVVGRLADTRREPAAERVTAALAAADAERGWQPRTAVLRPIAPAGDPARQGDANTLLARLGAAALVVLTLAILNAANLLLARGVGRRGEIGVRLALGAGRGRIVRLLLAESLLLAIAGGAVAALLGGWTYGLLQRLVFPEARWVASAVDPRTLVFIGVTAAAAGLAAGLAPALHATRRDVIPALRDARARGPAAHRTRAAIVIVQTALSLALVVSSTLLALSLARLHGMPLGFDPRALLTITLTGNLGDPDSQNAAPLAERLRAVPGVRGAAVASVAPFGSTAMMDITIPGAPFAPEADGDLPRFMAVSDEYFAVMGMRVLEGRAFGPGDLPGAEPVAVINEAMWRRYWGSASPLSSCIQATVCARIVGIVEDVREDPAGPAPMRFYLPLPQWSRPASAAIVRAEPSAVRSVAEAARSLLAPGRRGRIEVVADRLARTLRPWRTATALFLSLGALALALAGIGIYSVMTYLVSTRAAELGIRIALGATYTDVMTMVLRSGLRLVAIGIVIGLALAAVAGRLLGSLVFAVSPLHPAAYAAGCLAVLLAALAAMLAPVRRAASVDPASVLRVE